jgi:hypothetical protein
MLDMVFFSQPIQAMKKRPIGMTNKKVGKVG